MPRGMGELFQVMNTLLLPAHKAAWWPQASSLRRGEQRDRGQGAAGRRPQDQRPEPASFLTLKSIRHFQLPLTRREGRRE